MLITNATIITWGSPNQNLETHALYIENDRIREVGPSAKLKSIYPESETLDARRQIIIPGRRNSNE
jgi:cytosine/adenosine deaminase-related metal-dependent hydrolase